MKKKYLIEGVGDVCPLCLDNGDGRAKEKRPPVFLVACEGGYCGAVCAPHLVALMKAADPVPGKPEVRAAEPRPEVRQEVKPPLAAVAAPVGNGPTTK